MENRYGHINCPYCDKTNIKSEILGKHLFKCHKSNLIENFGDYINMEYYTEPLINLDDKSYTFCFGCHVTHNASKKLPSKPAIKHQQVCSHELQLQNLKSLCATQSINTNNNEHSNKIAELKSEMSALRQELYTYMKNNEPVVLNVSENNSEYSSGSSSEPDSDDELFHCLSRVKELDD